MDTSAVGTPMPVIMILLLYTYQTFSQFSEDSCNWIIWDAADEDSAIRSIEPACDEGNIQWRYPTGGISVTFSQHHASFQLCFIAHSKRATIQISSEGATGMTHLALLTPESRTTDGELCVKSTHGHNLVLFIESVRDTQSQLGLFELDYEFRQTLLSLDSISYDKEDIEICRPCTDTEIIDTVCYGDFVVRGSIGYTEDFPHRKETEVHLNVQKIFRQLHPIFRQFSDDSLSKTNNLQSSDFQAKEEEFIKQTSVTELYSGHVIAPHICRVKRGEGDFLFIGKIRLKRAHLSCAVRGDQFDKLWKSTMQRGENACIL